MTDTSPHVEIRSYGRGGISIHISPRTDDINDTVTLADVQHTLRTIADSLKETR